MAIVASAAISLVGCSSEKRLGNEKIVATGPTEGAPPTPLPTGGFTAVPNPMFLPLDPDFANQANFKKTTNPDAPSEFRTGILEFWRANPQVPSTYVMGSTVPLEPSTSGIVRSTLSDRTKTIAILDTGKPPSVLSIPDLAGKIVDEWDFIANKGVSGDNDGEDSDSSAVVTAADNVYPRTCITTGTPLIDTDSETVDHGVSMMSIAGAAINGIDMVGVAPGAFFLSYRVIPGGSCGNGTIYVNMDQSMIDSLDSTSKARFNQLKQEGKEIWDGIVRAIYQAVGQNASVINMSFGSPLADFTGFPARDPVAKLNACADVPGLQGAIDYAYSKNIPVVVAAGNSSVDIRYDTPASCKNVFIANGVDFKGQYFSYSNYFTASDIASNRLVFGVDIDGAMGIRLKRLIGMTPSYGHYVTSLNGGSVAAATLSGIIANLRSFNPNLTPNQIRNLLWNTGTFAKNVVFAPATPMIRRSDGKLVDNPATKYYADVIVDAEQLAKAALVSGPVQDTLIIRSVRTGGY